MGKEKIMPEGRMLEKMSLKLTKKRDNLLAVRIHPWQLFRFRKWVERSGKSPSQAIQEALQIYFSTLNLPKSMINKWLSEYRKTEGEE